MRRTNRTAFTLVELLVVIGIIALLISMLLPALNRARAQANIVDCQSRMRQIGLAIFMYAQQNKDYLPHSTSPSSWTVPAEGYIGGVAHASYRWLPTTLTRMIQPQQWENWTTWHPMFKDVDTIEYNRVGFEHPARNHYNFNLRLFVDPTLDDRAFGRSLVPMPKAKWRRLSSVNNSSGVIAIYDGTPFFNWSGNAYHLGDGLRSVTLNFLWYATYQSQVLDVPNASGSLAYYDEQIIRSTNQGHVDWRHGKRDTANVMMLDGHCESRKLDLRSNKGDMRVKEFCTNRPPN